jgi:DUF917 family protein
MLLPTIDGIPASPVAISDEKGNSTIVNAIDNLSGERIARQVTIEMGCSSLIAMYAMSGAQAKTSLLPGTMSLIHRVGTRLAQARKAHEDPVVAATEELLGRELLRGKIIDVTRRTERGFARGEATLAGLGEWAGQELVLKFQNEHLMAVRDGQVVASTPDLICVLDAETGEPVTTESMRYGFRIAVIGVPCHPRWRSAAGLAIAGPKYFGYDHEYVPVEG